MPKCRDCGHPIAFVQMRESGKLCPVAPAPDEIGTIVARRNDRPGPGRGPRYVDGVVRHLNVTLDPGQVRLIHHRGVCTHPRALPRARPIPTVAELTTPQQPTLV